MIWCYKKKLTQDDWLLNSAHDWADRCMDGNLMPHLPAALSSTMVWDSLDSCLYSRRTWLFRSMCAIDWNSKGRKHRPSCVCCLCMCVKMGNETAGFHFWLTGVMQQKLRSKWKWGWLQKKVKYCWSVISFPVKHKKLSQQCLSPHLCTKCVCVCAHVH